MQSFNELKLYQQKEGHLMPPARHTQNGIRIGGWVRRQQKIQHKLSSDQKAQLTSIGFTWDASKDKT